MAVKLVARRFAVLTSRGSLTYTGSMDLYPPMEESSAGERSSANIGAGPGRTSQRLLDVTGAATSRRMKQSTRLTGLCGASLVGWQKLVRRRRPWVVQGRYCCQLPKGSVLLASGIRGQLAWREANAVGVALASTDREPFTDHSVAQKRAVLAERNLRFCSLSLCPRTLWTSGSMGGCSIQTATSRLSNRLARPL